MASQIPWVILLFVIINAFDERCSKVENGKCTCCKSKYGGFNCTIPCQNCRTIGCDKACKSGYYGSDDKWNPCNKTCSHTCANRRCNSKTGECVQCVIGHYGPECKSNCSSRCKRGCLFTGHCNYCNDGYYGPECQWKCSTTCLGGCLQNNGTCVKCEPKKHGDHCERDCSTNCTDALCYKENGSCISGCIRGRYGVNCTGECSDNCKGSECIQTQDSTLMCTECIRGYWGLFCENRCPVNCLRCGQSQGKCVTCEGGFMGANCFSLIPVFAVPVGITVLVIIVAVLVRKDIIPFHRLCFHFRRLESSQNSQNCHLQNMTDIQQTGCSGSQSDTSYSSAVESTSLLEDTAQNATATNDDVAPKPPSLAETVDECQSHQGGGENRATRASSRLCSSPSSRRRNGVRADGFSLGTTYLEDFRKSREGESHMKVFWTHLGYSEENIPTLTDGDTVNRMLKTSPNLQGQEPEHVIYKIILALRFAGMYRAAEELVTKHEDCLPSQFMDELRKVKKLEQRNSEHSENITVPQGCRGDEAKRGNYIGC